MPADAFMHMLRRCGLEAQLLRGSEALARNDPVPCRKSLRKDRSGQKSLRDPGGQASEFLATMVAATKAATKVNPPKHAVIIAKIQTKAMVDTVTARRSLLPHVRGLVRGRANVLNHAMEKPKWGKISKNEHFL